MGLSINQSKRIYIAPYVASESDARRAGLGRVFTFAVRSGKQFSFRARRKLPKDSADLQLYDSEFQTDGALTLKAK